MDFNLCILWNKENSVKVSVYTFQKLMKNDFDYFIFTDLGLKKVLGRNPI